jgi:hypothetical protein
MNSNNVGKVYEIPRGMCECCGKDLLKHIGYQLSVGGHDHVLEFCSDRCMNDPEMRKRATRMNETFRATKMALESFFKNSPLTGELKISLK